MRRVWLAIAVTLLITATVVVGWAADLTVNGGTLQVFTFPADLAPIAATVDIDPDTLNPRSHGNFVTAYIELPDGFDVADIDVSTVTLAVDAVVAGIPAEPSPTEVADNDADGVPDLMVKFGRQAVVALLDGRTGDITFRVRGEVSGSSFEGTDTIRVLDSHGGPEDTESGLPEESLEEADTTPAVGAPSPPMPTMEYKVRRGDTLWDIAKRFGTTVQTLGQLNDLKDPATILYGSTLNVPYVGENPESSLPEEGPEEAAIAPAPPPSPIPTTEYEVKPGDTLWDIAERFGTTVETLAELNGLEDPTVILYGSTLNVPRVGEMVGEPISALSP